MLEHADNLRVVLVGSRNPLNIGAAARAMSNFGFFRLRVVKPYDVAFREARSAMSAAPLLASAVEHDSVAEAVADCTLVVGTTAVQHRELNHKLLRLADGAKLIRKEIATGQVALLFGTEKTGLTNDELSHCHWLIHIPTSEQSLSMNLGQAVAICLYELTRDATKSRFRLKGKVEPPATAGQIELMSTALLEALQLSGYINPLAASSTEERVRRMLRSPDFTSVEVELWLGMLRQILWKMRAGEEPAP